MFAEAAGCAEAWKKVLEGWNVIQSKQVLEWQQQARIQGELRERANSLLDLLEEKFGPQPEELSARIRGRTDLDLLRRWFRLGARAATLDQFRQDAGL